MTAPSRRSRPIASPTGTARTSPPWATAIAATVPAAWPMAMHWAIERIDAWASWVAEKQRPATSVVRAVAHDERAQRDPDRGTVGQVAPRRAVAAGAMVVLDRGAAEADLVVELARRQHVLGGHPVVAVHAARLAHADPRPEGDERGAFVAGHAIHEEPRVLERLSPSRDLELGQDVGVRGVAHPAVGVTPDLVEAGHDRGRHPLDRRHVVAALEARQVVARPPLPLPSAHEAQPCRSSRARPCPRWPSGTSSSRSGPAPRSPASS